jgi:hypothetical protein
VGKQSKAWEKAMNIDPNKIKAGSKTFDGEYPVEVFFYYNRQKERYEFRVRWPEGRYVNSEIALRFAGILSKALDHLRTLQQRLLQDRSFLRSDFDVVVLFR